MDTGGRIDPLVSVVIPNYNYARYVSAAVESALSQTYTHVEVIVVDDGSTDNSIEVLRTFENKIRIIQQKNSGQSISRNRGISEARGDFVAFLDADDLWMPTKLEKQMALFRNPSVGLVYCGVNLTDSDLKTIEIQRAEYRGRTLYAHTEYARAVVLGGESTAVVRKEVFLRAGLFDPALSLSAGWDMWRRIASAYEIDFVDEPLIQYRQHGSNVTRRLDVWEHDIPILLMKMFGDPASKEIFPLKSSTYGKFHLMLSGAFYHQKNYRKFLEHSLKAVRYWPGALGPLAQKATKILRTKYA